MSIEVTERFALDGTGSRVSGSAAKYQELGLTVYEDVVPETLLAELNATIDATRNQWSSNDGGLELDLARSFGDLLRRNESFRSIEREACGELPGYAAAETTVAEDTLHSLRCVDHHMPWQSHLRHHDSHWLTLLIPLQLAQGAGRNGDLVLYKMRRESVSTLPNMIYKTWLVIQQNRHFRIRRRQTYRDLKRGRCRRIACKPGNVYAFNGFLCLHANLDIESGERRSLLIHYYDPCLTAGIKNMTRRLQRLREWFTPLNHGPQYPWL
jgi:hypothetical protein